MFTFLNAREIKITKFLKSISFKKDEKCAFKWNSVF